MQTKGVTVTLSYDDFIPYKVNVRRMHARLQRTPRRLRVSAYNSAPRQGGNLLVSGLSPDSLIDFTVLGHPISQGSMKVMRGHIMHAKDKELKAWRNQIGWTAKPFFSIPLDGAVLMQLDFSLIRPKTSKRNRPSVKPDLDKLIRAVLDALTGVAYTDDSQVVRILAQKSYGSVEGVRIIMALDV